MRLSASEHPCSASLRPLGRPQIEMWGVLAPCYFLPSMAYMNIYFAPNDIFSQSKKDGPQALVTCLPKVSVKALELRTNGELHLQQAA